MDGPLRTPLALYLAGALLLRFADEGARVGLVLLAAGAAGASGATGSVATGGLLVAALLVPHVVAAPALGAVVDRARRPPGVLALAATGFAAALAASAAGLGRTPLALVVAVLVVGGCCGPALTGSLTSRLVTLVSPAVLPRAFGADALTYTVAGVAGPAVTAVVAQAASPAAAVAVLAASATLGAGLVALLPVTCSGAPATSPTGARATVRAPTPAPSPSRPRWTDGVRAVTRDRVLAVVTLASSLGQVGPGALPVVAVVLAARARQPAASGWLLSAAAVGGLAGSLAWTAHPARAARAPAVVLLAMAGSGAVLALAAAVPSLPVLLALFAASGAFTGPFIGALFTVRSQRSPEAVRAQVFGIGAGLKTSATAAGAALGGAVAGIGPAPLLLVVAAFPLLAAGGAAVALRRLRVGRAGPHPA